MQCAQDVFHACLHSHNPTPEYTLTLPVAAGLPFVLPLRLCAPSPPMRSRRSRGFGYVTFQGEVPEGVIDKDHLIDGRMCGARLYKSTRTAFGVCAFLSLPI